MIAYTGQDTRDTDNTELWFSFSDGKKMCISSTPSYIVNFSSVNHQGLELSPYSSPLLEMSADVLFSSSFSVSTEWMSLRCHERVKLYIITGQTKYVPFMAVFYPDAKISSIEFSETFDRARIEITAIDHPVFVTSVGRKRRSLYGVRKKCGLL